MKVNEKPGELRENALIFQSIKMRLMTVQFYNRGHNGKVDSINLSDNSVGSVINVVQKCLYDIDHPLPGQPARSIEQQRLTEMERVFYEIFIEKLRQLS